MPGSAPSACFIRTLGFACLFVLLGWAAHGEVNRVPLSDGSHGVLHNGRSLFLELTVPTSGTEAFLKRYLANGNEWTMYRGRGNVVVPFNRLSPTVQRSVLLAVFAQDVVDAKGWLHTVSSSDENLSILCEWLTGKVGNTPKIVSENKLKSETLLQGQQVTFPLAMLRDVMKTPTPNRKPPAMGAPEDALIDLSISFNLLDAVGSELTYGRDKEGPYAEYLLKKGEALYSAVVVRFTDYSEPEDVLPACDIVQKRSGITDVHSMRPGERIRLPLDMLADRFKPEESPERKQYEEVVQEAKRLKGQVQSRALEGIVVVLDPGHGGRDYGATAPELGLFEDELNYDIAVRVKNVLESQTRAKVYITMWDPDQDFKPMSSRRFVHDTDEHVLTTPRYCNLPGSETDAGVSVNLRWCMANTIYARERAKGVDPRKFVFTSFHCDALFNSRMRGTMVYIPGASLRRDETCSGGSYSRFQEVKEGGKSRSSASERRRDEALSRNFAEVVLDELGKKRIRRHQEGDPIRSQIRKSPTNVYVPAVLRNTMIPTKILVEAANLTNPTDCQRLADPQWRQAFAEAYVAALRRFYDDETVSQASAEKPSWAEDDALEGPKATTVLPPLTLPKEAPASATNAPRSAKKPSPSTRKTSAPAPKAKAKSTPAPATSKTQSTTKPKTSSSGKSTPAPAKKSTATKSTKSR